LAAAFGLRVDRVWDDSTEFGYWGSELYRRGVSLFGPADHRERSSNDYFTEDEMKKFRDLAREDNEQGMGGRSAFILRRDDDPQSVRLDGAEHSSELDRQQRLQTPNGQAMMRFAGDPRTISMASAAWRLNRTKPT
jgi:hypothetical protein